MKKQHGQVLLITVMLLATALTVVLSLSFKSTTETKVTKLEEESQKTLAAAEAAIEASLRSGGGGGFGTIAALSGLSGIDLARSSVNFSTTQTNSFTTPLLQKDEQYTFYLADYSPASNTFGNSIAENLTVCFTDGSVLELTLIKGDRIKRYAIDTTSLITGAEPALNVACSADYPKSYVIPVTDIGNDSKVLIARRLSISGKILFTRSSNFPLQGKTITSSATSITGVTKKVTLFQSYPQIPAEFFITSF